MRIRFQLVGLDKLDLSEKKLAKETKALVSGLDKVKAAMKRLKDRFTRVRRNN